MDVLGEGIGGGVDDGICLRDLDFLFFIPPTPFFFQKKDFILDEAWDIYLDLDVDVDSIISKIDSGTHGWIDR